MASLVTGLLEHFMSQDNLVFIVPHAADSVWNVLYILGKIGDEPLEAHPLVSPPVRGKIVC